MISIWRLWLNYYFLFTPFNKTFTKTPTIAAKLNPDIVTASVTFIPIINPKFWSKYGFIYGAISPTNNIDPITIIFFQLNLTFSFFIVLAPINAIILNNIKLIPPITGSGIVLIAVPNLATKLRAIANNAVILSIEGS